MEEIDNSIDRSGGLKELTDMQRRLCQISSSSSTSGNSNNHNGYGHRTQSRASEKNPNRIQVAERPQRPSRGGEDGEEDGSNSTKRPHSVKVPQLYKKAAKALAEVESGSIGLRNAIHGLHHPNVKAITSLVTEALKHNDLLAKMISKSKILENEKGLANQPHLAKILITELVWGKKRLGGESKPIVTVLSYKDKFTGVLNKMERKDRMKQKYSEGETQEDEQNKNNEGEAVVTLKKPRYVRVNTLKMDLETAINYLTEEGWIQEETEDYLNLGPDSFTVDNFVDNLLVFSCGAQLFKHPLYLDGTLVLQDKASCLPPLALKPRLGRTILDACAAPGMKTSLLSALTRNEGSIIAVERDLTRCDTLQSMLNNLGVNNVEVLNMDFTDMVPADHPEVEYILVDPSCSGSGMHSRREVDHGKRKDKDRLKALSFYQRKLLNHAMKFPNVKRIVYSTCSINNIENEEVIAATLRWGDGYKAEDNSCNKPEDNCHLNFKVARTLPNWSHRLDNPKYDWSELCVKADFENDWTDGFFVAVLERVKEGKRRRDDYNEDM